MLQDALALGVQYRSEVLSNAYYCVVGRRCNDAGKPDLHYHHTLCINMVTALAGAVVQLPFRESIASRDDLFWEVG